MPQFQWNADKDRWLQVERQMSFAQLRLAILSGGLLDIIDPSNPEALSPSVSVRRGL